MGVILLSQGVVTIACAAATVHTRALAENLTARFTGSTSMGGKMPRSEVPVTG